MAIPSSTMSHSPNNSDDIKVEDSHIEKSGYVDKAPGEERIFVSEEDVRPPVQLFLPFH